MKKCMSIKARENIASPSETLKMTAKWEPAKHSVFMNHKSISNDTNSLISLSKK